MSDARIRVLIVDDHPVVREGLRAMLCLEEDLEVVDEAGNGADAIATARRLKPNIVLMDLLLPDMHGSEVIRGICADAWNIRVIVITSVAGDEDIHRALEAGARGYLFKDMVRRDLVQAIREIHAGKRYIPAQVGAQLAQGLPRFPLSAREIEVLRLVAVGKRNKEIAFHLAISEATVNAHLKHVAQKLNASDRTEAVTIALRRGFIHL